MHTKFDPFKNDVLSRAVPSFGERFVQFCKEAKYRVDGPELGCFWSQFYWRLFSSWSALWGAHHATMMVQRETWVEGLSNTRFGLPPLPLLRTQPLLI